MTSPEHLVSALRQRLDSLRSRVEQLSFDKFGEAAQYCETLSKRIVHEAPPGNDLLTRDRWLNSTGDCLSSLRELSLGQTVELTDAVAPPVAEFLQSLTEASLDPEERFQLLVKRYSWPPNVSLAQEAEICEHVLMRLMVHDRAVIERRSLGAVNADDLLLKLNLAAVHAQTTSDLRFLDALNYYYELLPADWVPPAPYSWLLISYFGFYARALLLRTSTSHEFAHRDTFQHTSGSAANL